MAAFPRLSDDFKYEPHPKRCQECGALVNNERGASIWLEHDDDDSEPSVPVFVVLCPKCARKIISRHPRLYSHVNGYIPGAMPICLGCTMRRRTSCMSPVAKFNGGPGLDFVPPPGVMFVCCTPRSKSRAITQFSGTVTGCSGFRVVGKQLRLTF